MRMETGTIPNAPNSFFHSCKQAASPSQVTMESTYPDSNKMKCVRTHTHTHIRTCMLAHTHTRKIKENPSLKQTWNLGSLALTKNKLYINSIMYYEYEMDYNASYLDILRRYKHEDCHWFSSWQNVDSKWILNDFVFHCCFIDQKLL